MHFVTEERSEAKRRYAESGDAKATFKNSVSAFCKIMPSGGPSQRVTIRPPWRYSRWPFAPFGPGSVLLPLSVDDPLLLAPVALLLLFHGIELQAASESASKAAKSKRWFVGFIISSSQCVRCGCS